jgi:hypothetical protein
MTDRSTRTLDIVSHQGLGNRLRMLISGMAIAEASDRYLTMYWNSTRACGCVFPQLFQNHWNVKNEQIPNAPWIRPEQGTWQEFPDLLESSEPSLFVQYYGWLLQPNLYPHHARLVPRCVELFSCLELAPELDARVQTFRQQFFRAPVIGVHLRRSDFIWTFPNSTNNLNAAFDAVENYLAQAPNALVLVCTDDGALHPFKRTQTRYEGIREKFIRRFGNRIISPVPSSLDRSTPIAIQDALVELWLLRHTDFFVGTLHSSFSELAAWGRTIPVTMTSHPQKLYRWIEQFLAFTRLERVIAQATLDEFGQSVPLTILWSRYRARVRYWFNATREKNPDKQKSSPLIQNSKS